MKTMRKISVVVLMFYYTTGVNKYGGLLSGKFPQQKICPIPFRA